MIYLPPASSLALSPLSASLSPSSSSLSPPKDLSLFPRFVFLNQIRPPLAHYVAIISPLDQVVCNGFREAADAEEREVDA